MFHHLAVLSLLRWQVIVTLSLLLPAGIGMGNLIDVRQWPPVTDEGDLKVIQILLIKHWLVQ